MLIKISGSFSVFPEKLVSNEIFIVSVGTYYGGERDGPGPHHEDPR